MSMIERVARAIYDARKGKDPWEMHPRELRRQYEKQARAAIEAMREPTPGMLAKVAPKTQPPEMVDFRAAQEAVRLLPATDHPDAGDVLAELSRDWRAMISSILETKE